jgi:hypothetical protein
MVDAFVLMVAIQTVQAFYSTGAPSALLGCQWGDQVFRAE